MSGRCFLDVRGYILSKFPDKTPSSGGQLHTQCPFHDDNSPSFSIDIDRGVFVCGSPRCGVRGSFAYFYKLMEGIESWAQVYRDLRVTQVTPDIEALLAAHPEKKRNYWISEFPQAPQVEPIVSVAYLTERGIGPEIVGRFGLLYGRSGDSAGIFIGDSIVVPVYDLNGAYITFQVRYLNPDAKLRWRTPTGSPIQNVLYGGWLVSGTSGELWVVEGPSDVWNMAKLGCEAVGLFTKEASAAQLNRLRDLSVRLGVKLVVCMDGDAVVQKRNGKVVDYGRKIYDELCAFGLDPALVHLEKDEDPGALSASRLAQVRSRTEGL